MARKNFDKDFKLEAVNLVVNQKRPVMKCPLRIDSQGNASECYKDECAWWVIDAEIEGSKSNGTCAVLEVAVNGLFVTIGEDDEEE